MVAVDGSRLPLCKGEDMEVSEFGGENVAVLESASLSYILTAIDSHCRGQL